MSINHTPGENYDGESLKERYVFHYDLPSLQEIASYEVCRTIWYSNLSKFQRIEAEDNNVIHCRIMIGFSLFFHYENHNKQLIKHLNVPALIEGILENSMNKVCKEIEDWVLEFYYRTINLQGHCRIHVIDPKWLAWSVNGEIDYSKSARRVLQDVSLTEWQKFLVMCKYCMTDEISKFSLDSLPPQFFTENCHYSNFICFYWICFLRNELHRIPVRNNDSIDWTISRYYAAGSPIVKQFFWDRLSDDQQVTLVVDWINLSLPRSTSDFITRISLQIISKMSLSQQQRLLCETRHTFVSFFASCSESSRCALWAWRYAGNQMTEGQFANLIKTLLETSINGKSTSLLNEIWNTASAHQRNHVIQYKLDQLIKTLKRNGSTCSDRFLQFISEDERKESIFRSVTRNAIQHCNVDNLSNFLNEYLPCPEDQSTFRKLIIDSPAFLEHLKDLLLDGGKYKEIDETLKFYFSHDAAAAEIFKRDFLEQKLKTMDFPYFDFGLITSIDKWNGLSRFIDEVFDEDPEPGLMVKKWFITSAFTHNISRIWYSKIISHLSQSFDDFVKIVETVFKNDELENVKRLFSDQFCSISTGPSRDSFYHVTRIRDNVFLLKFMQWCSLHNGKPF